MIALVDGDIICYRSAASCEPNKSGKNEREDLRFAIARAEDLMQRTMAATSADSHKCFISGPDNFRYQIDPQYKANRADTVRPEWLQPVREYLVTHWDAHVSDGIEADDNLGIYQTEDTVICSIDKDLLQIPGKHYNFITDTWTVIDDRQGLFNFYQQLIMGDRSDNIPGYDGKMRIAVPKFLQPQIDELASCYDECDMYNLVYDMYEYSGTGFHRMHINGQLLYIQRCEGDSWIPPV